MAKVKAGKEVAERKSQLPAVRTAGAGRGFEEADADSYAIPFLTVMQKTTPWCDPDDEAYIKGAKPGMFINTVTLEMYEEVSIMLCHFQRVFIRWAPRSAGGGFKGIFQPSAIAGMEASGVIKQSEEGRWYFPLPDGTINETKCDILTDTRHHFCMIIDEESAPSGALVSLSRTQLKKSKNLMAAARKKFELEGGDMFDWIYTASTRDEENDKGKWKGWVFALERKATAEERATGESFYNSVASGAIKVKHEKEGD